MFGANKVNHEKWIKQFYVVTAASVIAAGSTINSVLGDPLGLGGGQGGAAAQGQQVQQMVDPFAAYRPQYAAQLSAGMGSGQFTNDPYSQQLKSLVANPTSVQQQPGYQAQLQQGTQAVQRQAAQTGQLQSGRESMALQDYASGQQNTWFQQQLSNLSNLSQNQQATNQQQFSNLSQLSGAGQAPSVGGTAGINAANTAAQAQQKNIGALGGAVGQIGQAWNSMNTSVQYSDPGGTNMMGQSNYSGTPYAGGFTAAPGWFGQ